MITEFLPDLMEGPNPIHVNICTARIMTYLTFPVYIRRKKIKQRQPK